jgi:hypothetical protein
LRGVADWVVSGAAAMILRTVPLPWCRLSHIGNKFPGVGVHASDGRGKVPRPPGQFRRLIWVAGGPTGIRRFFDGAATGERHRRRQDDVQGTDENDDENGNPWDVVRRYIRKRHIDTGE